LVSSVFEASFFSSSTLTDCSVPSETLIEEDTVDVGCCSSDASVAFSVT